MLRQAVLALVCVAAIGCTGVLSGDAGALQQPGTRSDAKYVVYTRYLKTDHLRGAVPAPPIPFIRWTYDKVGNRLTEQRPSGTTAYAYDARDRRATRYAYFAASSEGDENGSPKRAIPNCGSITLAISIDHTFQEVSCETRVRLRFSGTHYTVKTEAFTSWLGTSVSSNTRTGRITSWWGLKGSGKIFKSEATVRVPRAGLYDIRVSIVVNLAAPLNNFICVGGNSLSNLQVGRTS